MDEGVIHRAGDWLRQAFKLIEEVIGDIPGDVECQARRLLVAGFDQGKLVRDGFEKEVLPGVASH